MKRISPVRKSAPIHYADLDEPYYFELDTESIYYYHRIKLQKVNGMPVMIIP